MKKKKISRRAKGNIQGSFKGSFKGSRRPETDNRTDSDHFEEQRGNNRQRRRKNRKRQKQQNILLKFQKQADPEFVEADDSLEIEQPRRVNGNC